MMGEIIKALAFDIDGTLFDNDKQIPIRNKQEIQKWAKHGIHIILASGRMTNALSDISEDLETDCILLGYNGSYCLSTKKDNRKELFHFQLPLDIFHKLIEYCETNNHFLNMYIDGEVYGISKQDLRHFPDGYHYLNMANYFFIDSYDKVRHRRPTKLLIIKENADDIEELFNYFNNNSDFVGKVHIIRTHSYNQHRRQEYIEFLTLESNKGLGLERLCKSIGIGMNNIMAFGDADNDKEMLAMVGRGVCMAQGSFAAKQAATSHISQWKNDEDAIARELLILESDHLPVLN